MSRRLHHPVWTLCGARLVNLGAANRNAHFRAVCSARCNWSYAFVSLLVLVSLVRSSLFQVESQSFYIQDYHHLYPHLLHKGVCCLSASFLAQISPKRHALCSLKLMCYSNLLLCCFLPFLCRIPPHSYFTTFQKCVFFC